ncbi:hypothetical protein MASR2M78_10970 [Treponema sp.]
MSKKSNTLLFLLGATLFNIVITVLSFIVLIVLYGRLLAPLLPQNIAAWGLPIIFIAAIALAFVIYRYALKIMMNKVDIEKTFDPLFMPRHGRKK